MRASSVILCFRSLTKALPQCQEGFGSGLGQSVFIRVSLGSPRTPLASDSQVLGLKHHIRQGRW